MVGFAESYQHWYGAASFLRCPMQTDLERIDIGVVGVPFGGGNPIEHMQYLGPRAVRTRSMAYARSHREFGINPFQQARIGRVLTTADVVRQGPDRVLAQVREVMGDGPVYLTSTWTSWIRATPPGVADPEMDGLSSREIMQLVHELRGLDLMGADIVCYCPPLDNPAQTTGLMAGLLPFNFVTLIADRKTGGKAPAGLGSASTRGAMGGNRGRVA